MDARFPLRGKRRDFDRALLGVEDRAAELLTPAIARAAYDLPDNEGTAALDAAADAMSAADLSDSALFAADLAPGAISAVVRSAFPLRQVGLSDRATDLYLAALEQSCVLLVHLLRELPEFDAATAVEMLTRQTATLSKLDQLLTPDPDRPASGDIETRFRDRYLAAVVRAYDRMAVIGLTTHHYEPRTTLSVAYLSLSVAHDEASKNENHDPVDMSWMGDFGPPPPQAANLRVEAALGCSTRTVIRGEAGAGKSTLLCWLAVNAARGTFTDDLADWNGRVPFLVNLRDFADKPLPRADALVSEQPAVECGPIPNGWVHRCLASGSAILLVDGVDELPSEQRDAVRIWLRAQLGQYPDIHVVVTSRPTVITPAWLAVERFRSVELEPMTPTDVQVFLQRWHSALLDSLPNPAMLPCRVEEISEHEGMLLSQLRARPHLRALARNPLLCAMLCALNLDRKARLPRDRIALYSAALEMLLERRDADRGVATTVQITPTEKLVLLRALAWWLQENNRNQMSRDQALSRLRDRLRGMPTVRVDPTVLLDHLVERSGVIHQPVLGTIDFIHRTFQEFLAAEEAVDRDSIDMLIDKARSDMWRETLVMACAHASAEQRGRLLTGILDKADKSKPKTERQLRLLVAACREAATLVEPAEVISRLEASIQSLVPPRNFGESRSLATVGESILDYFPVTLEDLPEVKAIACLYTATLINGPKALDTLARHRHDPRKQVQAQLVRSWRYFDPRTYAEKVLADAPLVDGGLSIPSTNSVPHLKLLRNLHHCFMHELTNTDFLTDLPDLQIVALFGNEIVEFMGKIVNPDELTRIGGQVYRPDDLAAIAARFPNLRMLSLSADFPITDLGSLAALPLDTLDVFRCPSIDLCAVSALPRLRQLYLTYIDQPVDLSPLTGSPIKVKVS